MRPLLEILTEAPSFYDEAGCIGTDPGIFFASRDSPNYTLAKFICASCEVQFECLEYAIATNQKEGIWGGRDPRERRRLRTKALK